MPTDFDPFRGHTPKAKAAPAAKTEASKPAAKKTARKTVAKKATVKGQAKASTKQKSPTAV